MNENQYKELCEACDRILLAPDSTIERVAIPWLHVIREHPVFLTKYADLFAQYKIKEARISFYFLKQSAKIVYRIVRSFRFKMRPWTASKIINDCPDFIFISHFINKSQAGNDDDFYFGNIPNELFSNGYKVLIVLINHTNFPKDKLALKWLDKKVPRLILSNTLGIRVEAHLFVRLVKQFFVLRKKAKRCNQKLEKSVLMKAAREALTYGPMFSLRMYKQMQQLVALRPKAIILTHEGHSWERVSFAAARSINPKTICVGYQHALLFRLQHAIKRNLFECYNPDYILTSGQFAKEQLEKKLELNKIPKIILGSNRSFFDKNRSLRKSGKIGKKCILVIPEGDVNECNILFEFSLEYAKSDADVTFIWRLHPLILFENLVLQNNSFKNLPENIIVSSSSFKEDIESCNYALYRGTTAIIQAIGGGLRPVYLKKDNEMTIDPLFELKNQWKMEIKNYMQFKNLLSNNGFEDSFLKDKMDTIEYCKKFFSAFNINVLPDLIKKIDNGLDIPTSVN